MNLYLKMLKFLKPYRMWIVGSALCAAGVSATTGATAWLIKPMMDDIFVQKDEEMLLLIPLVVVAVSVFKGLFTYGQSYMMRYAGSWIISDIRRTLYAHMLHLPIRFHTENATGQLISRIVHDVQVMQGAVSTVVKDLFQQSLTLVVLIAVIFYHDWKLALFAMVGMPIMIYPLLQIGRRMRKIGQAGQERAGDLTSILQETLSGIRVVKAFGRELFESKRFELKNNAYYKTVVKAIATGELASPLNEVILSTAIAGVLYFGGARVISGEMSSGTFFSFIGATTMMYGPIKSLTRANNQIQQALASAERVFAILDQPNEMELDQGTITLTESKGDVSFESLSFSYGGSAGAALSDISLKASSGDIIAFVGSSGAGKTTLINMIPRFFEATSGRLLVDGHPVETLCLASLRAQIGIVSQETVLFDESVAWNIAYGTEGATDAEIRAAAKAAYADQFIEKLPEAYETQIEKGGANFSGGERQRLAIARALLKNPPILILDEATSALDTESEYIIGKALAELMKDRTTFVIAHRLSTIRRATRIFVMDHGKIVEEGNHESLMKHGGFYEKVYQMQFKTAADTLDEDDVLSL